MRRTLGLVALLLFACGSEQAQPLSDGGAAPPNDAGAPNDAAVPIDAAGSAPPVCAAFVPMAPSALCGAGACPVVLAADATCQYGSGLTIASAEGDRTFVAYTSRFRDTHTRLWTMGPGESTFESDPVPVDALRVTSASGNPVLVGARDKLFQYFQGKPGSWTGTAIPHGGAFELAPDGTPTLVWDETNTGVHFSTRTAEGTWTDRLVASSRDLNFPFLLAHDTRSRPFVAFADRQSMWIEIDGQSPTRLGPATSQLSGSAPPFAMAVDGEGTPLFAWSGATGIRLSYGQKTPSEVLVPGTAAVEPSGCPIGPVPTQSWPFVARCTERADGSLAHAIVRASDGKLLFAYVHHTIDRDVRIDQQNPRAYSRAIEADRSKSEIVVGRIGPQGELTVAWRVPDVGLATELTLAAGAPGRVHLARLNGEGAPPFNASGAWSVRLLVLDTTKL